MSSSKRHTHVSVLSSASGCVLGSACGPNMMMPSMGQRQELDGDFQTPFRTAVPKPDFCFFVVVLV